VWIALRPEKVRIATVPPPDRAENCVTGRVWDIGYLGDVSTYNVRIADGLVMKARVANVTRLAERPIGWDDQVFLTWTPDAGVLLTA
jgi:putrescine transport system ATP-binding protein